MFRIPLNHIFADYFSAGLRESLILHFSRALGNAQLALHVPLCLKMTQLMKIANLKTELQHPWKKASPL